FARYAFATDVQTALRTIDDDLEVAQSEPNSLRPPPDWFDSRRSAAAEMRALLLPLVLRNPEPAAPTSIDPLPTANELIEARLVDVASKLSSQHDSNLVTQHAS